MADCLTAYVIPGLSLIDIGCSSGKHTFGSAELGLIATGLDWKESLWDVWMPKRRSSHRPVVRRGSLGDAFPTVESAQVIFSRERAFAVGQLSFGIRRIQARVTRLRAARNGIDNSAVGRCLCYEHHQEVMIARAPSEFRGGWALPGVCVG